MTSIQFGQIIEIRPEQFDRYKSHHVTDWPDVLATIKACNIQNYSIFRKNGISFACFEYTGNDFNADMLKMQKNTVTREWWKIFKPMQQPVTKYLNDGWRVDMKEVFHLNKE